MGLKTAHKLAPLSIQLLINGCNKWLSIGGIDDPFYYIPQIQQIIHTSIFEYPNVITINNNLIEYGKNKVDMFGVVSNGNHPFNTDKYFLPNILPTDKIIFSLYFSKLDFK